MTKVELEVNDNLIAALNKVQNINDSGIELVIPEGSVLFDTILNLKILKQESEKNDQKVTFTTKDINGLSLIEMLDDEEMGNYAGDEMNNFGLEVDGNSSRGNPFGFLTSFFSKIKPPKVAFSFKFSKLLILLVALGVLGFGIYKLYQTPVATIKIVVDSEPLARSVSIKVKANSVTDKENSVLAGKSLFVTLTELGEKDTTGTKTVGDTAEGEVIIYNKTTVDIELDEGTELAYKEDDEDLIFYSKDGVTIPAIHEEDPSDPASALIPGEATVSVESASFGKVYNIDKDSTLEFEDYKKSELVAVAQEDFEGGKSETVSVVIQEDKDTLSQELLMKNDENSVEVLEKALGKKEVLVENSSSVVVDSEEFSNDVGEETDLLKLAQTVSISGLSYSKNELEDLFGDVLDQYIPEGFEVADDDMTLKVTVLGNTDSSVLSFQEADLQVTAKTQVVPVIDENALQKELTGKKMEDAQKVLGSIRHIDNYEINISPGIPFFTKMPRDPEKINLEIRQNGD